MAATSARRVALAALKTWRKKSEFADAIISRSLAETALAPVDRAFAVELFYGVLRNRSLLDFWIRQLRRGRVDFDLCDILRLGLYQLFFARTPEHAAVYETVATAPKTQRPAVNAILRTAVRRREELQQLVDVQSSRAQLEHAIAALAGKLPSKFSITRSNALPELPASEFATIPVATMSGLVPDPSMVSAPPTFTATLPPLPPAKVSLEIALL